MISRLISKDDVCEILADIYPTDGEKVVDVKKIDEAYDAVLRLLTAEPKVTHCENCERFEVAKNGVNGFCNKLGICMDTYDYCSRAEEREDENDTR